MFSVNVSGGRQLNLRGIGDTRVVDRQIIKAGLEFAKRFAPGRHHGRTPYARRSTGALRDAIYAKYARGNMGVYVRVPRHPDNRRRNYHLWMHGRGRYNTRTGRFKPKTGYPDFMFRTARFMRRIAKARYSAFGRDLVRRLRR